MNNTTNTTTGSTVYATLISPPIGYNTTQTALYPYSANQVITIGSANNNQYFGFRGSFTITTTYSPGV
jgi:hypothetical protein